MTERTTNRKISGHGSSYQRCKIKVHGNSLGGRKPSSTVSWRYVQYKVISTGDNGPMEEVFDPQEYRWYSACRGGEDIAYDLLDTPIGDESDATERGDLTQ